VIDHLIFFLESELRSNSALRPDPQTTPVKQETVLRSIVALRPDLIATHIGASLETVLQTVVAQRPDTLFLMPTNRGGRVDTAWLT
jgi:hypothetical protein